MKGRVQELGRLPQRMWRWRRFSNEDVIVYAHTGVPCTLVNALHTVVVK